MLFETLCIFANIYSAFAKPVWMHVVPTFTQCVNETHADTMNRKMLKPPGTFTVNVPRWFVSIVVNEREMKEELKVGAL